MSRSCESLTQTIRTPHGQAGSYSRVGINKGTSMIENIENLVLEQLRALRADIASVKEDTREIKTRLTVVESGIASLWRDNGDFAIRSRECDQHSR